jgi:hypothetical protein
LASYIQYDGKFYTFVGELPEDIDEMEIGKAYIFENLIYIYWGVYNFSDSKPGLYLDAENELVLISYPYDKEITSENIVHMNSKEKLLEDIKKLSTVQHNGKNSEKKKKNIKENLRKGSKEPIHYKINDEDDEVVRLLKSIINEEQITMQDIYDHFDDNNSGYNLFYGLLQRNSLAFTSVKKWAEVLGKEVIVKFVDIEDKKE